VGFPPVSARGTEATSAFLISLLVAIGVNERGYREILCERAKERGLKGVRLSPRMPALGLPIAPQSSFQRLPGKGASWHWYRNVFSHVPSTKVREIAAMLKAIHADEDIAAAHEKAIRVIETLRGLRLSRAAELVEAALEETLTYYAFPEGTGGGFAPTTRSSVSYARSDGARVWCLTIEDVTGHSPKTRHTINPVC
jgi:transposase-like protein